MKFDIKKTTRSALDSAVLILKLVIPLYILSDILLYMGWLDKLSFIFEPITAILHLPTNAALSIAAGVTLNIYAAIALAAPLGLTPYEWTILGLFLGVCHSMVIESAIMKKIGIPYIYSIFLRGSVGFIAVLPLSYFPKSWFSSDIVVKSIDTKNFDNFWQMLYHSSINSLSLSFKIILLIVSIIFLMDFIKSSKIMQTYMQKVSTVFSITAGLILGITYGAGVLINEAKSGSLTKRDIFFIATFLMICHSVIEDTLLFVIFGANYAVLVTIRVILAIIVSFVLSKIVFDYVAPALKR